MVDEVERLQKELLELLEQKEESLRYNKLELYFPDGGPFARDLYQKHVEFMDKGADFRERAFIAANRVGKSLTGGYEMACHLTGIYPHWWEGKKFLQPVDAWAAGRSNQVVKEVMQELLLGKINDIGSGLIPKHLIHGTPTKKPNVANAIETVFVKHISGGLSQLTFKSYEQGRESFQGVKRQVIWLDEEPDNPGIYSECLLRLMDRYNPGIIYSTFTPLFGLSDVVTSFMPGGRMPPNGVDRLNPQKFIIGVTWDDVPHLSEKEKEEILKSCLPYERMARSKGIPSLGAGAIYPYSEDDIVVTPFKIPDYWPKVYGLDVGWNRCLAKDSMVLMSNGTKRPIQEIKIGEEVLAFDFKTENLVPTKVIDTFKGFASNVVTTGISKEQTITCTDDHPFAHRAQPKDKIKFKKIKDIKNGIREFQSVVLPSKWDIEDEQNICSAEMARIVGYLLGDGCLTYTNRRLEFAQTIPEFIDDMSRCLAAVNCEMKSYANTTTHYLSGREKGNNLVLDFIKELGLLGANSKTKFIPSVFYKAKKDLIANLLVGLIHTDGSVEGDHVRYYTVSRQLAEGVKILCLRLGIYASISCDNRKRKDTHNKVFRVTLRRPTCLPLQEPKKLVLTRPERKKRSDRLIIYYEKAPPQDIYCITVEHPDHAFICNDFVVSNTAAIWLTMDPSDKKIYAYSEHYEGQAAPAVHASAIKARGEWIPGTIDPAARNVGNQSSGERLIELYEKEGLLLVKADNERESGFLKVGQLLESGRLKIFSSLHNFLSEFRTYRRDENGKVVKKNDHLMDAFRYAVVTGLDLMAEMPDYDADPIESINGSGRDEWTGY